MSKPVSIKDLEDGKLINKPVHVFGWVKHLDLIDLFH